MSEEARGPVQIMGDEVREFYLIHVRIGHDNGVPYIEGVNSKLKASISQEEYDMFRKMNVKVVG